MQSTFLKKQKQSNKPQIKYSSKHSYPHLDIWFTIAFLLFFDKFIFWQTWIKTVYIFTEFSSRLAMQKIWEPDLKTKKNKTVSLQVDIE
jgi:hypothetical protein